MNDDSTTPVKNEAKKHQNSDTESQASDLLLGTITFIVFIIFMTTWMYFSTN